MKPEEVTILVVDDDRVMRNIYKAVLTGFGVQTILEASTCEVARGFMVTHTLHGAFVDLVMPCCSGLEIANDLQRLNIPIVFSTGVDDDHNRALMSGYGFTISKPLSVQAIQLGLRFFLG